jgi:hypothetical protein
MLPCSSWLFSIRHVEVKHNQAVLRRPSGDATRGSALLFGISRMALPAWDQGNGAAQSDSRPDRAPHDRHKSRGELTCPYRKLKLGHNGDAISREWAADDATDLLGGARNWWITWSVTGVFGPRCNRSHRISECGADAARRTRRRGPGCPYRKNHPLMIDDEFGWQR